MFRLIQFVVSVLIVCTMSISAFAQPPWSKIGRTATTDEIAAWDIDVRADFTGLPKGQGSALQGEEIWVNQCESCHGEFGQAGRVFTPLVGGTTKQDIISGRVAALQDNSNPFRSTLMRASKISTLWDYINRAMPWNAPKSLTPDQVYAVTAYILFLGDIIEEDFVMTQDNIAQVQQRLPNRNGVSRFEPMWRVDGKPDVQGQSCMTHCDASKVRSSLPASAQGSHGDLSNQHRLIGGVRGGATSQ